MAAAVRELQLNASVPGEIDRVRRVPSPESLRDLVADQHIERGAVSQPSGHVGRQLVGGAADQHGAFEMSSTEAVQ